MYRDNISLIFIILLLLPAALPAKSSLKIAYPEFYPFFAEGSKGEINGFFYEIISRAAEKMDVETKWTQMPWKRCQIEVKNGHFDAMVTVPTKERLSYSVTHKDPFYMKALKIFTYKNHPKLFQIKSIKSISDIRKQDFSVITYSGNGWNDKNIAAFGIRTLDTSQVHYVWKMLAARRGDLVIEWPVGAYESMRKADVRDSIVEIDVTLDKMPFHLLISKKSKAKFSLERFNRVIKDMRRDGTINKIVSSYY